MLVLNRRRGEAIVLDGGIRIVVLDSDNRGARIGIEAPRETRIQREELVDPSGVSRGSGDGKPAAADPPESTEGT